MTAVASTTTSSNPLAALGAALRREHLRTRALLTLTQLSTTVDASELIRYAVEQTLWLTESTVGYFAVVDEAARSVTIQHWSELSSGRRAVGGPPARFAIDDNAFWAEMVRRRETLVANGCADCESGVIDAPFQDLPLVRQMHVPIVDAGEVVIVAGVANKPTDYHEEDAAQFTLLLEGVWNILRRQRDQHELQRSSSALAAANARLEEMARKADSANLAKSAFLANISHELRTPLHGILSFATFGLKQAETGDRARLSEYFTKIDQSGRTLLALVEDLLDLSALESGRASIHFAGVHLEVIARTACDQLQPFLASKNASVEQRYCGDLWLEGDQPRLGQLIWNLVSNAAKYGPTGGVVEVTASGDGDRIRLEVADRGPGIPPDELELIFDGFVQSSKTRTGAGGTGLGLAICRQIATAHAGRIWAENRPGGGSLFVVDLPARRRATDLLAVDADGLTLTAR